MLLFPAPRFPLQSLQVVALQGGCNGGIVSCPRQCLLSVIGL